MKRTPLRSKTPLRTKPKPGLAKPRPRLAKASGRQAERLARYNNMLLEWKGRWACAKCGHKKGLEPHHPFGRGRENLFRVVLLCRLCHAACHEFPDLAYELGWLQPEYRGTIRPPNFPVPWKPKQLITLCPPAEPAA